MEGYVHGCCREVYVNGSCRREVNVWRFHLTVQRGTALHGMPVAVSAGSLSSVQCRADGMLASIHLPRPCSPNMLPFTASDLLLHLTSSPPSPPNLPQRPHLTCTLLIACCSLLSAQCSLCTAYCSLLTAWSCRYQLALQSAALHCLVFAVHLPASVCACLRLCLCLCLCLCVCAHACLSAHACLCVHACLSAGAAGGGATGAPSLPLPPVRPSLAARSPPAGAGPWRRPPDSGRATGEERGEEGQRQR